LQKVCNVWAPAIEILAVRVTKPRIPEQIKRNYGCRSLLEMQSNFVVST
jgi:hypothetical protein